MSLAVSRGTADCLDTFAAEVTRWATSLSLVGPAEDIGRRHVADSAQMADFVEARLDRFIDLGSGAGFPGIVTSILTGAHADLVESDKRKASFLLHAAGLLKAPVKVHRARAESVALAVADLITARALAPLFRLLPLVTPLLTDRGCALFAKGASFATEIAAARGAWTFWCEAFPSALDRRAAILRIRAVARRPRS